MTPDEKFMIRVYRTAMAKGDAEMPVDFRKVADELGQKATATKNIIKHLAQANLVIKVGGTQIQLTPRGRDFVLDILP